MSQTERKFLKKSDLYIVGILVILAIGAMWFFSSTGNKEGHKIAQLSVNGEQKMEFDLTAATAPEIIDLAEKVGVPGKLEIKEHKIRFIEVDCPDHICMSVGFIGEDTQTAVCMPNRAALSIYTKES